MGFNLDDCKHATATHCAPTREDEGGIDLFDDEFEDANGWQTSIYQRHKDGKRFPARTVTMFPPEHFKTVLEAWGKRGPVHDYRTTWHGIGVQGIDMRDSSDGKPCSA